MSVLIMGAHALLSPSAASRWLHCTASPLLEARIEDTGSTFAEEGTLAHACCARRLKAMLGMPTDDEDATVAMLAGKYDMTEIEEHARMYADTVWARYLMAKTKTADALLLVEIRLELGDFVPESFGTADAVIIADRRVEVIDFKYGKGVAVAAHMNPQMMIYGLGVLEDYGFDYGLEEVSLTIVQPRLDNVSTFAISADELYSWARFVLRPAAKDAMSGGWQRPGDWCRFCKVRSTCAAIARMAAEAIDTDARTMDETEVAAWLPNLPVLKSWVTSVEADALQGALSGVKYPGYKLVEGRSVRRVTDPAAVADALRSAGIDEANIMKPAELQPIGALEKTVGRSRLSALCGRWIKKPEGKPTLVPVGDKRQEITGTNTLSQILTQINTEEE